MLIDFWNMLGSTFNAYIVEDIVSSASNIITTDNPVYTVNNFYNDFPVFEVNDGIVVLFLSMAHASIKYDRYKTSWRYLMGLYIAHYYTLWLRTQLGEQDARLALQGSLPTGIQTSMSAGGVSVSLDFMGMSEDLHGYGTYKLTAYGQQLVTMTKMYGKGGMWVNG